LISCVGSYFFIIKKFKLRKKDSKAQKKEGSRPGEKIIIILILIFYIFFFASQKAMMVRNYIFFLPFIAFFFSITFNKIIEFLLIKKSYYQTFFLSILLISMFVINFNKIYEASISMEYDKLIDQKKLIDEFVVSNKDKKIVLSDNASIFFKNLSEFQLMNESLYSYFHFLVANLRKVRNEFPNEKLIINDLVKKIRDLSKIIILSKQISIRKKIGVIRQLIIPILHKQG
jgi:hypothetical protein